MLGPFKELANLQRQIKHVESEIDKLTRRRESLEYKNGLIPSSLRKARTRTLIQLGGLIEKVGLLEEFEIELGTDLQKDPECKEQVHALLGGLIELKSLLHESQEYSKSFLALKGKLAFGKDKDKQ